MIKQQSEDPNVEWAANSAYGIVNEILKSLPKAQTFDYGGHDLHLGEYGVCEVCTVSIAEAQQAAKELLQKAEQTEDALVREHLELAASMLQLEAEVATVRAELHNGKGTEKILNALLGFEYDRKIQDDYSHNHHKAI